MLYCIIVSDEVLPRSLPQIAGSAGQIRCRCQTKSSLDHVAGIACSMMIAQLVYDVPSVVILNSCVRAITAWDLITSMIKAWVFGAIISIVSPPL